MKNEIIQAIENRQILEFEYDSCFRRVEPHTFGVSSTGKDMLSAYQIEGDTVSGNVPDWKQFSLNKIKNLEILNETFTGTRLGYTKGDSRMTRIYCEL